MTNKQMYCEQGFLLFKGLFEKGEIEQLRGEAKAVFAAQLKGQRAEVHNCSSEADFEAALYSLFENEFEKVVNCGKQVQHLIALHRLGTSMVVVDRLKDLGIPSPVISVRPVLYFNSPRLARTEDYWRLGAHQDWRSSQGSLDSITVWVPLVDINRALGTLEVIPGSHKWGLLRSEKVSYYGKITDELSQDAFLSLEVEQGDALFFSSFLIHRSGTNSTKAIRWSCHFRYNNLSEPTFIERGYPHPFSYKPQAELITSGFPCKDQLDELFS